MRIEWSLAVLVVAPLALVQPAVADVPGAPAWSNDFVSRIEALAVLQTLNADLLSHDSATLTLDRWCDAHRLAAPAKIVAVRDKAAAKQPTAEQRKALGVADGDSIRYRRVKLMCGTRVLSEADNWYVPARLTPEMNHQLESSDIAFGRVVAPLHFQRHTLAAKLLWSPLPDGWDMAPPAPTETGAKQLEIPHEVLQHQAVLTLPDGTPFSEVIETYTSDVLGFPQPRAVR